jgi:anti-sigma regulatory factor (Ser/Thr protein kinase)
VPARTTLVVTAVFDEVGLMETINIGARFAPTPASVAEARRFVLDLARTATALPEDVTMDVALLVSELATNAVIHARTPFRVDVAVGEGVIRVEVEDEGPGLPRPRAIAPEATTGRGLLILDRLADRWGTTPLERGKRVWFERLIDAASAGQHHFSPA